MEPQPLAVCRRDAAAEDPISGLPDELLLAILVRLQSAAAAARTSVLARRWRGFWTHMPELVICVSPAPPATPSALLDSVDAALNSYAAPTLDSLKIEVTGIDQCDVPADRIAPWLRFAAQRLTGKLHLSLKAMRGDAGHRDINEELVLPVCERATEIDMGHLTDFVLRPPSTGTFSALTDLNISCTQMDGGELGRFVSSLQCPRLRKLCIFVAKLAHVCDVSICSESLECLDYRPLATGKLEVQAPMLQEISVSGRVVQACIVAPKLEKVKWSSAFNPAIHQFSVARRHLQSLRITHSSFLGGVLISSTRLMERYDTAKELKVSLGLHKEIAGYVTFMKEMDKLPICESLDISLMKNNHSVPAIMMHILKRCSGIRKLKLLFFAPLSVLNPLKVTPCSISGCLCLLPENYRLDDIAFDSLEEIKINLFTGSDEQEEFMKLLLSKCNMVTLKMVDIMVPDSVYSEIMEVVERIRSVCHSNSKVQFNVHSPQKKKY